MHEIWIHYEKSTTSWAWFWKKIKILCRNKAKWQGKAKLHSSFQLHSQNYIPECQPGFDQGIMASGQVWAIGPVHKGASHVPKAPSWLGSWFELCAFTSVATAIPITNRICALRDNILFLLRRLTHAWLQRAQFQNAHARITFRKSFAFTKGKIRLSRRITIQNALRFAFQKPDLKELCVHKG